MKSTNEVFDKSINEMLKGFTGRVMFCYVDGELNVDEMVAVSFEKSNVKTLVIYLDEPLVIVEHNKPIEYFMGMQYNKDRKIVSYVDGKEQSRVLTREESLFYIHK